MFVFVQSWAIVHITQNNQRLALIQMICDPLTQPNRLRQLFAAIGDGKAHDFIAIARTMGGL